MKTTLDIHGDLNPGTWFHWDEDDPESGKIKIRVADAVFLEELYKRTRADAVDYQVVAGQMQRIPFQEVIDEKTEKEELWDYSIMDWQNFVDAEGNEIPCTKENKLLLVEKSPDFLHFISRCQKKLSAAREKTKEGQEKN